MTIKSQAIEANRLLNDFILDLVTGTRSIEIFELPAIKGRSTEAISVGLFRMALFHILITLSKWTEFYDRYKSIIPDELKDVCRALRKKIQHLAIRDFRHRYIGHVWDKKKGRPLLKEEIDVYFSEGFGEMADFIHWVNKPGAVYPETVVSICESLRDSLRSTYEITDKDMFPWKPEARSG